MIGLVKLLLNEDTLNVDVIRLSDEAWNKVLDYVKNGLPSCYKSFKDYTYDFYPDLPWHDRDLRASLMYLLKKPQVEFDLINKSFGIDFRQELTDALAEIRKNLRR